MSAMLTMVCSRNGRSPHRLATVTPEPDGDHSVTFEQSVLDVGGHVAAQSTVRLSQLESRMALCRSCRMRYPLVAERIRAALDTRQRFVVLDAEGFFLDPIGVLESRHGVLKRRHGA